MSKVKPSSLHDDSRLECEKLQLKLKELTKRLKLKNPWLPYQRRQRPWILVIGYQENGKTTFIQSTHSDYHPTHQYLNYVINDQAVIVELNAKVALPNPKQELDEKLHEIWRRFFKRYHRQFILQHLLVLIDVPTLTNLKKSRAVLKSTEQLLSQLRHVKAVAPITFVISKCDLITGFNEFFADINHQEAEQLLGMNFTKTSVDQLSNGYKNQSQLLMSDLNHRLLWRLHHERSQNKRNLIQSFPAQFEQLLLPFQKLIHELGWSQSLKLDGIYFCSCQSISTNKLDLLIKQSKEKTLLRSLAIPYDKVPALHHHYFVKALWQRCKKSHKLSRLTASQSWLRMITIPLMIVVVIVISLVWHTHYRNELNTLHTIETALSNNSVTHTHETLVWLKQLNLLQTSIAAAEQTKPEDIRWQQLKNTSPLVTTLVNTYKNILQHNLAPYLQKLIQQQLSSSQDPNNQYQLLVLALMLSHQQPLDNKQAISGMKAVLQQQFAKQPDTKQALLTNFKHALALDALQWQPDKQLIDQTRQQLLQLPTAQLAYILLEQKFSSKKQWAFTDRRDRPLIIKGLDLSDIKIPELYLTKNFTHIYSHVIPTLAKQLLQPNPILDQAVLSNKKDVDNITPSLQLLYLNNYTQQWLGLLNQIRFQKPQNLNDIQNDIALLEQHDSALWQLLHVIIGNIQLSQKAAHNSQLSTPAIDSLSQLLNDQSNNAIDDALTQLKTYLNGISQSKDPAQNAYQITAARFNNGNDDAISQLLTIAAQQPQPLQAWLESLANNSWQFLLSETRDYLNDVWAKDVWPTYAAHLDQRYPLFSDAKDNISLNNFTAFFGPNGIIQNYFTQYLQPFVDLNQAYWTWKKIGGTTLGFPQSDLDLFIRASLIQKMFFSENNKTPAFQFQLSATGLSATVKTFIINIEGQMVESDQTTTNSNLNWPGPDPGFVTMRFELTNGDNPTITTVGPWALFRMLDKMSVQSSSDPKTYQIIFASGPNEASYQLTTNNIFNPFIPNTVDAFRCPKTL